MSTKPEQIARVKDLKKYSAIFREDKDFLIFEIEKRNRVIKLLADGIKSRLTQRELERLLDRAKNEFEKLFNKEEKQHERKKGQLSYYKESRRNAYDR